jgi:hypothetical protein
MSRFNTSNDPGASENGGPSRICPCGDEGCEGGCRAQADGADVEVSFTSTNRYTPGDEPVACGIFGLGMRYGNDFCDRMCPPPEDDSCPRCGQGPFPPAAKEA